MNSVDTVTSMVTLDVYPCFYRPWSHWMSVHGFDIVDGHTGCLPMVSVDIVHGHFGCLSMDTFEIVHGIT